MKELDAVREAYLASVQCLDIVSDLLARSRKGSTFHGTIFWNQPLDEARRIVANARAEANDLAIVSLVSVFERILFDHPHSPLRSKSLRQGATGLHGAIADFKRQIDPRVYEDVERLCQYRDWVAHGRRWERPIGADPINTHARLRTFLMQAGFKQKDKPR